MKLIAEISANHKQNFEHCLSLISQAHEAGADFVKLQCYTAESICFKSDKKILHGPWAGSTLHDLYTQAQTPLIWFEEIFRYCEKENIPIFSSVFDRQSFEMMKHMNAPMIKIASTEAFHGPLLKQCLEYDQVPLIISLGKVYDLHRYFSQFESYFDKEIQDRREESPIYFFASECSYVNPLNHGVVRNLFQVSKHVGRQPSFYRLGYSHNSRCYDHDMINSLVSMDCEFLEVHFTEMDDSLDAGFSLNSKELRDLRPLIKELEAKKHLARVDNGINLRAESIEYNIAPECRPINIKRDLCPPLKDIISPDFR